MLVLNVSMLNSHTRSEFITTREIQTIASQNHKNYAKKMYFYDIINYTREVILCQIYD